ncbi:hypothetical protein [Aquisphaera insulae]|uniref:hypothetical protein n=1 Tax=Aquisphaera insulae TaxID=2712864 RepID=UPI0013ED922C|nr:hypothetical protein [Aquisphaera insulae]
MDSGPVGPGRPNMPGRRAWLEDPRSFVLIVLGSITILGIAWKLLLAWRTRRGVARLLEADVTPEEVAAAAGFQRAGLMELFRIMGDPASLLGPAHREAAATAIATLWAEDQLVSEEEQGFVRRGYAVNWKARRRYPRALGGPLPIAVEYGVPALRPSGPGVRPDNLEWSHRVLGAHRASLEQWSPWVAGPGRLAFEIMPGDFEGIGPHRLVLETRVRTRGLTTPWEIELPKVPFPIELDPRLEPGSMLAAPDEAHGRAMTAGLTLEPAPSDGSEALSILPLNQSLGIRNPPVLRIRRPLPRDLAHRIRIQLEGIEGTVAAGSVVLSGHGADTMTVPIGALGDPGGLTIDRPGMIRARAVLEPDESLGWSDPDLRSVWPGILETEWQTLEIIRI